ncbi:hypothetical protein vseg_018073 [Gypsophila vaccaria]
MSEAAPTGCYKCGRPGHWSRDCPASNPNPTSATPPAYGNSAAKSVGTSGGGFHQPKLSATAKPKKAPRTRPKITPDLLLSDNGLGYILRYFPRNFKCRGRGYEVNDLGNLLRMYAEWHSQLIPYFPFDQFIHKIEDAGSRRVKTCIAELKERVANGGDPTKLRESEPDNEILPEKEDVANVEEPANHHDDMPFVNDNADEMHEDIFREIYNKTAEGTSDSTHNDSAVPDMPPSNAGINQHSEQSADKASPNVAQVTEEQKALMEAKRLKALERAAARFRLLKAS